MNESPGGEVISTKRVVYAEIDDEVTAIYDKFKAVSGKHIYIVVPQRSILFQSVVNLKILKRKAEDDGKKIYLITNDKNGIHLAQKIGVEVYNKTNDEGKPALFSHEEQDEKLKITPLKASINSVEEETPTRLKERKLTISEILHKVKGRKSLDVTKIAMPEKSKVSKPKFVIVAPNRQALIALISISLVILLVIVYIALPGVTVYLTPSASVLEKSVNITLADYQKNRSELETHPSHTIASYSISKKILKSLTHYSTGKKFSAKGSNAGGNITIFNTTNSPWPLIATTRFQTPEGIVFRIAGGITIPAATNQGPGKIDAYVTADQLDAYGAIVGDKGNIGPTRFFLPGLKDDSKSKIYAENAKEMSDGVTDYVSYISKEDVEAAKVRLAEELKKSAVEELKLAVKDKSELVGQSGNFSVLEGEGAIKVAEVKITIDPGLENKELSEFTLSGEVEVSGVYYDHDEMLEILKDELMVKKSPQKELLRINENSTTYRIFQWDEAGGKIKLTANIKGVEQYLIDEDKEAGANLLEKIKEHIAGKDIEEAKLYIQNLPEINKVEIESWPAWSPTVPGIEDNIEFEIRDAVEAQ